MTRPATSRSSAPAPAVDIGDLLSQAPVEGVRAERHLWLIAVMDWVRQGEPISGMQYLARHLVDDPARRAGVVSVLAACVKDLYFSSLLADHGFANRAAFWHEFRARIRDRILPTTPDTEDMDVLFDLLFDFRTDRAWMAELDDATLQRLGGLLQEAWAQAEQSVLGWREPFMLALSILASQVRATGMMSELRLRMGDADKVVSTFTLLARATEDLQALLEQHASACTVAADALPAMPAEVLQQAQGLRALLDRCVALAEGIRTHLEAFGVSVDVVFQIDQLRLRCLRMEQLLDCLISPQPRQDVRRLLLNLLHASEERCSLGSLFGRHYSLLSRLVSERNAETGSHYITRTRAEYADMLKASAGGGFVIGFTTFAKFLLATLGLSPFWIGFSNGLSYAISFVIVHLLHWTVATKQPAMTAPAMAEKLRGSLDEPSVEAFVREVAHLMRSQVAGIVGNLAVVFPTVLLVQALVWSATGRALVSPEAAQEVLKKLTLLGPTFIYAAFTGVLLFASSIVAGWTENWFVWHRLDSALRWNPRIRARLGVARAERWAVWWRANISGLAANVLLGLMLGLTPTVTAFFGLPLEVRHVTLSTGQIAAALGTLGPDLLHEPAFWYCVAALPLTAVLNVGVSFALALRVAMVSRGVKVNDRLRLGRRLLGHFLRHPGSFLWPPQADQDAAGGPPPPSPPPPPPPLPPAPPAPPEPPSAR